MAVKLDLKDLESFSYRVEGGVAVITFDEPGEPVNTLSREVGTQFERQLERALKDDAVKAVVFTSGKKDNFVAGAKIDFLQTLRRAEDGVELSRWAQKGFDRLDAFPKTVVAAIHGSCLGGGLEWALACDYRIGSDSPQTTFGQPEVQLGLIPGAGGTQRLPRLIGTPTALDLILTGKTVRPSKARKLGLVDEVVPKPILLAVAIQRAQELASGKRKVERKQHAFAADKPGVAGFLKGLTNKDLWSQLALEDNPLGRRVLFEQARKKVLKRTQGKYPAPLKALEAVRAGIEQGVEEGSKLESQFFGELVVSDVSRRLVEIFFATTELKKENGTADPTVKARPIKKVGILGGGLMGGGIAYVTAAKMSVPVRIKERDDASAGRALKHVAGLFQDRVEHRELTWRESNAKMAMVTASTDLSGFRQVDMVIEAVFEDLSLKHKVLQDAEAVTSEQCIFASNTSALPIGKIAAASRRPQTVIGMHYFSPVNKMPLLEVIRHTKTDDWVAASAVEVGKKQGKTVIVVNDGPGFYTSRILAPYMNEASQLLVDGADILELDRALVEFGFPVGPIVLLDEVGIDVAAKVAKFMHESFGERLAPPQGFEKVLEGGRTGRKGKKGFYLYNGKRKGVDESVYALLPQGTHRKRFDREEMAERCTLQLVNEAIRCLEENILRSPRDGDVGAIFGLGFPPFLGGPFRYVDSLGASKVLGKMERWQEALGRRFEPAPMLKEMAKFGKKFYPS